SSVPGLPCRRAASREARGHAGTLLRQRLRPAGPRSPCRDPAETRLEVRGPRRAIHDGTPLGNAPGAGRPPRRPHPPQPRGPGTRPGEVLYTLDTEGRTAICLFATEDGSERRLLHGSEVRICDVRAVPGRPQIACSVLHADGRASLALMDQDGRDLREVTEGD